jgi:uncharacterized protein YceK
MSVRLAFVVLAVALLGGCGTIKNQQTLLQNTLEAYAAVIRWGNFDEAAAFVDPDILKEHPISALDIERYRQVRVTGYLEQKAMPVGENEVRQLVEIGLVNVNSQSARSIVDRQLWRWDPKIKRWWLVSGLPDITTH